LKVVHFTNNLTDGAGKPVYRLHKSLLKRNIDSIIFVAIKEFQDDQVIQIVHNYNNIDRVIRTKFDLIYRIFAFIIFLYKGLLLKIINLKWKPKTLFNFDKSHINLSKLKRELNNVDIICLYSVQAFLSSKDISKIYKYTNAKIIWTPMDIEPLTGGCHFNDSCERYSDNCGKCPQLDKSRNSDISKKILKRKRKYLKHLPITFVAESTQIYDCIKSSSIFNQHKVERIFLGVDEKIFNKIDRDQAREILDLPKHKKLILFGCFNLDAKRKGGHLLLESLDILKNNIDKEKIGDENSLSLVTIGRLNSFNTSELPFEHIHLGQINDERILAILYNAVDLITVPSIDDTGPTILLESVFCSTPVVAFNVGLAPDLILSDNIGYIARNYEIEDFSSGIKKYLFGNSLNKNQNDNIKEKLSLSLQSESYISLFNKLE